MLEALTVIWFVGMVWLVVLEPHGWHVEDYILWPLSIIRDWLKKL